MTDRETDRRSGEPPTAEAAPRKLGRFARATYRALGCAALALAAAGVALPGLPATPFLLIALWAFSRGAPEWAERLRAHPRYGTLVRNWEARQAIPRIAKAAAVVSVVASWAVLALTTRNLALVLAVGAVLACVLAYVVSRPDA